jgi:hypothetical protein
LIRLLRKDAHALSEPRGAGRVSFLETSIGVATLVLERACYHRSLNSSSPYDKYLPSAKKTLQNALELVHADSQGMQDDDGTELLYGRAGLLYALIRLRGRSKDLESTSSSVISDIRDLCAATNLSLVVDSIIEKGILGAQWYAEDLSSKDFSQLPSLMWSWHGKRYLGAAHGVGTIGSVLQIS